MNYDHYTNTDFGHIALLTYRCNNKLQRGTSHAVSFQPIRDERDRQFCLSEIKYNKYLF